ncbi:hypothetical protein G7Z17_g4722 [Cylindrodendrum hubeiense]|uniref:ChrR-like cupin domain-containing protein n=1 Tax=Cylindrodendrum hubeiense TaxID=595255 RepID=A0A9P5L9Q9_9HYPO|nr:hypothetical protein G7Z17_g4722 [Cylindrodendrum hubeiense]
MSTLRLHPAGSAAPHFISAPLGADTLDRGADVPPVDKGTHVSLRSWGSESAPLEEPRISIKAVQLVKQDANRSHSPRKKKCDQVYPICGHCSRLNLVCQREMPRSLQSTPQASSELANANVGRDSPCCRRSYQVLMRHANLGQTGLAVQPSDGEAGDGDLVASRRVMLRYYTATLAIMLTTNLENNCFLSVLMPMAFECPSLMYALSAWSSVHLALGDERFQQVSLKHRGLALSQLKTLIREQSLSTEMSLAVTMVLCSMESIADGTGSWYHHLAGAAAVLGCKSKSTTFPPGSAASCHQSLEGRWLLRNFAYHDILMSVSMDRRPFLAGDYWLSEEDTAADPYFGFASRVLQLIAETSILNADFFAADASNEASPPTSGTGSLSKRAHRIETQLKDWVCPSEGPDDPLALLGEAYRIAALIHLYRTLSRHVNAYKEALRIKIRNQAMATETSITQTEPVTKLIPPQKNNAQEDDSKAAYRGPPLPNVPDDVVVPGALDIECDERLWVPQAPDVWFRPLLFSVSQGYFVNILRVRKSGILSRHRHAGPVHATVLRGRWHYLEHPWWATEGGYAFEPPGDIHTLEVPEDVKEMVTLFHVTGAYIYVDPDGNPVGIEDVFSKLQKARKHYEEVGLGASFADQFIR